MQQEIECDNFIFSSKFDSGNCCRVESIGEKSHLSKFGKVDNAFTVDTHADPNSTYHTWFHFAVKKQKVEHEQPMIKLTPRRTQLNGIRSEDRRTYTVLFKVNIINEHQKLYEQGMKPVYRYGTGEYNRIPATCYYCSEEKALYFAHVFYCDQIIFCIYFSIFI
jgi:hypothetical protein